MLVVADLDDEHIKVVVAEIFSSFCDNIGDGLSSLVDVDVEEGFFHYC